MDSLHLAPDRRTASTCRRALHSHGGLRARGCLGTDLDLDQVAIHIEKPHPFCAAERHIAHKGRTAIGKLSPDAVEVPFKAIETQVSQALLFTLIESGPEVLVTGKNLKRVSLALRDQPESVEKVLSHCQVGDLQRVVID